MNKFITIMFSLFAMIMLSSIAYAQQTIQQYHGVYRIVERCYTVLFPYPHSRCEYVQVRRNYTPLIPYHHHNYRPLPYQVPRHGHHPPHHNGNHHHSGHRR